MCTDFPTEIFLSETQLTKDLWKSVNFQSCSVRPLILLLCHF